VVVPYSGGSSGIVIGGLGLSAVGNVSDALLHWDVCRVAVFVGFCSAVSPGHVEVFCCEVYLL
jgi:hypothetical protein